MRTKPGIDKAYFVKIATQKKFPRNSIGERIGIF